MKEIEIKQALACIGPTDPVARAITALIAKMQYESLDRVAAPPVAVTDRDREFHAGSLAALRELRDRLAKYWAPTMDPPAAPADGVG